MRTRLETIHKGEESTIEIWVEYFAEFKIEELWPDGDAPDVITLDDVRALIDKDGGPSRVVDGWFFPRPDVQVSFRP